MFGFVFMLVSTFLGFCGFVDAWKQPKQAFRTSGHSKALWVFIGAVGMFSLVGGIVTWAIYSYGGVRRDVVKAGGYNRPSREARVREMTRLVDAERQAQEGWSNAGSAQLSCNCGDGKVPCYGCQGGWVRNGSGATVAHNDCSGKGWRTCQMCNGTGKR